MKLKKIYTAPVTELVTSVETDSLLQISGGIPSQGQGDDGGAKQNLGDVDFWGNPVYDGEQDDFTWPQQKSLWDDDEE